jgi:hypothetical protein
MAVKPDHDARSQGGWVADQYGFQFKAARPLFTKQHVSPKGRHAATRRNKMELMQQIPEAFCGRQFSESSLA